MVFPILSIFQDLDFDKLLGVGDTYMTSCTDGNYRMTEVPLVSPNPPGVLLNGPSIDGCGERLL